MRRWIFLVVVGVCVAGGGQIALSHDPGAVETGTTGSPAGDWTVSANTYHPLAHGISQTGNVDLSAIWFWSEDDDVLSLDVEGRTEPVIDKPWAAYYGLNPGNLLASSPSNLEGNYLWYPKRVQASPPRFMPSGELSRDWRKEGNAVPFGAHLGFAFDGSNKLSKWIEVGHIDARELPFDVTDVSTLLEDTLSGRYVASFERDSNDDLVLDSNGLPILVVDSEGRPEFEDAAAPLLRLTSEVIGGSTTKTVRYTLENFTEYDRDFSLPSVTSSSHPTGWSGTVDASDSVTLDVVVPSSEKIYQQSTALRTESVNEIVDGVHDLLHFLPNVLVPASRLECATTVDILSASYQSGIGNTISCDFDVEPPEWVKLVRVSAYGEAEIVADATGTFTLSVPIDLVDADPPPGLNTYYVVAGIGPNHQSSEDDTIQN